jgi:hypothetical protein
MIAACGLLRGKWDTDDLRRRLCRALDLAKSAIERFATNGYTDDEEPVISVRPEKVICETALLLRAASTSGHHPDVRATIESVARLLIPHARSARMLLGVCLEPALALDYAQAHVCLSTLGYRDEGFDELLRQSNSSQTRNAQERVPYRVLEQHWIDGIWTETTSNRGRRSPPLPRSALSGSINVLGGTRNDIYAFTHALMYTRDFNIRPRRLPQARAVILSYAEAALARCLDDEDYDLGGEVLMAWPLTGASWSAGAAFGFRVLARVEDENGVLPSLSTRSERLAKLEGDARSEYWLATAYHTAYVMGLLCAAALCAGRAPPVALALRSATMPGAVDAILAFLDSGGRAARWRLEFDQLKPSERDALAKFIFIMALYRNATRRKFEAVYELLKIGYTMGLTDCPTASQAAELLERLATFERITGAYRTGAPVIDVGQQSAPAAADL